jgi:hypothetical protein
LHARFQADEIFDVPAQALIDLDQKINRARALVAFRGPANRAMMRS